MCQQIILTVAKGTVGEMGKVVFGLGEGALKI